MNVDRRRLLARQPQQRLVRGDVVALTALLIRGDEAGHVEAAHGVRVEQRLLLEVEVLQQNVEAARRGQHALGRAALHLDARRQLMELAEDHEARAREQLTFRLAGGRAIVGLAQAQDARAKAGTGREARAATAASATAAR